MTYQSTGGMHGKLCGLTPTPPCPIALLLLSLLPQGAVQRSSVPYCHSVGEDGEKQPVSRYTPPHPFLPKLIARKQRGGKLCFVYEQKFTPCNVPSSFIVQAANIKKVSEVLEFAQLRRAIVFFSYYIFVV